jgi:carbon monoxide dehydrogenase subunit G
MAETEYSTTAKLPVDAIWDFVKEMDNWAEYLTGYQSHEKQSETESLWVLKGDVGTLSRTLQFKVRINEWSGPDRVVFELEGINEQMTGGGRFEITAYEDANADLPAKTSTARGEGVLARVLAAVLRFFHGLLFGRAERAETADAGPGAGMSKLTFKLRLDPGGPMAPMINAMMKPAMIVAAEDLANRIIGRLEREHGDDAAQA